MWEKLRSEAGCAVVTVPWVPNRVMVTTNPDGTVEEIAGVLCFEVMGKKGERRVFGVQKRSCWKESDIELLQAGKYGHRLNGTFCEFFIDDRFILRVMRVMRLPNFRANNVIRALFSYYCPHRSKARDPSSARRHRLTKKVFMKLRSRDRHSSKNSPQKEISVLMEQNNWKKLARVLVKNTECILDLCEQRKPAILSALRSSVQEELGGALRALSHYNISLESVLPDVDSGSVNDHIEAYARYLVAIQGVGKNPKSYQLQSAIFATNANPFMAWRLAVLNNLSPLRKFLGWEGNVQYDFPNSELSLLSFQLYYQLLQYGKKLSESFHPIQATHHSCSSHYEKVGFRDCNTTSCCQSNYHPDRYQRTNGGISV